MKLPILKVKVPSSIIILLMFLSGILLNNVKIPESWYILGIRISISNVLKNLGLSLMIAAILAITIDLLTKKAFFDECHKMIDDIKRSVYEAILRKHLPEPIFKEVEDNIFKHAFLRKDYESTICLERTQEKEIYRGKVEYSYWIVNLTDKEQNYPLKGIISTDIKLPPEKFKEIGYNLIEVENEGGRKIVEEKGQNIDQQKKPHEFAVHRELKLPARAKYKIKLKYDNYYKHDDLYVALTPESAIDFFVRVYHPEELDIQAWPLHSGGKGRFTIERKQNKILECKLNGGLLPYNGILVVWKSK